MEQAVVPAMEQVVELAMDQAGGQAVVEGQAGGRLRLAFSWLRWGTSRNWGGLSGRCG
jgi:hypothetical protein